MPGGTNIAEALSNLGWQAWTVGGPDAPPKGSSDHDNCEWCKANGAILVTHDRGKKNREILSALHQHQVSVLLVYKELRQRPPRALAKALLNAEGNIHQKLASGKHRLHHRLRPTGSLARL